MVQKLSCGHASDCGWYSATEGSSGCERSFLDLPGLQTERSLCAAALARAVGVIDALLLLNVQDVGRAPAKGPSTAVFVRFGSSAPADADEVQETPLVALKRVLESASHSLSSNALSPSKRSAVSGSAGANALPKVARAAQQFLDEVAGTPAQCDVGNAEAGLLEAVLLIAASGWQCASHTEVDGFSTVRTSSLQCLLCSRSIALHPAPTPSQRPADSQEGNDGITEVRLDCAAQHRYFCPHANSPALRPAWMDSAAGGGRAESCSRELKGWEVCALALSRLALARGCALAAIDNASISADNERLDDLNESNVAPEQAYKRIRSVLDFVGK